MASDYSFFLSNFRYFGMVGSVLVIFTTLYAASGYRGRRQEPYSFLNHFISELGEIGISRHAPVFNTGLVLGGMIFIPFIIGVGISLASAWGYLGALFGLWTAGSCALVGLFPLNHLTPHVKAAMSYFHSGLVTVLLTSLAILTQPANHIVIPYSILFISFFTILAYASFLLLLSNPDESARTLTLLDPNSLPERPLFWRIPALEWGIFISSILWYLSIAILMKA